MSQLEMFLKQVRGTKQETLCKFKRLLYSNLQENIDIFLALSRIEDYTPLEAALLVVQCKLEAIAEVEWVDKCFEYEDYINISFNVWGKSISILDACFGHLYIIINNERYQVWDYHNDEDGSAPNKKTRAKQLAIISRIFQIELNLPNP